MKTHTNPKYLNNIVLPISGKKWYDYRWPKPGDFSKALVIAVDLEKLLNLMLTEEWHSRAEIIPNYHAPFGNPKDKPQVIVRVKIHSNHPNQEEDSYAYLRYFESPALQRFHWDIYGTDMHSVENAICALMQAPAPTYCGPMVYKFQINEKQNPQQKV